jgi:Domain of unknown function (DUF4177)
MKRVAGHTDLPVQYLERKPTMKYEYQTIEMPFSFGIVKPQMPDITQALNEQGREGWQLKQIILPSAQFGSSDRVVLILERAIE